MTARLKALIAALQAGNVPAAYATLNLGGGK